MLDTASTGDESYCTRIASSANGLHFTHHWGFKIGSMTSPDLLYTNSDAHIYKAKEILACR